MRIKEGFALRSICNEHILVATGLKNIDFTKVVSLNESAVCLWNAVLDKDFTEEDMVAAFTDNYEVSEEVALCDVRNLLAQWKELGLIEE